MKANRVRKVIDGTAQYMEYRERSKKRWMSCVKFGLIHLETEWQEEEI